MESLIRAAAAAALVANPYLAVMGNAIFDTITSYIYKNVIHKFSNATDFILFYEIRASTSDFANHKN